MNDAPELALAHPLNTRAHRPSTHGTLTHRHLSSPRQLGFGAGVPYALGAGVGGAVFLWKSIALYRTPTKKAAMANFMASLAQLALLILGALADGAIGSQS